MVLRLHYHPYQFIWPTGDRTGNGLTLTGVDQVALAANDNRCNLIIYNNNAAACFVNFGAAAVVNGAGSIPVPAGQGLTLFGALPREAIHVIGTVGATCCFTEIF